MKPRLLILIVCAAGLAVFLATRAAAPPGEVELPVFLPGDEPEGIEQIREMSTLICDRDLPGSEPQVPPEFDIRLEVDPTGKKNRLYFYITEVHGYYVEAFDIDFYFRENTDIPWEEATFIASTHLEDILRANETLKGCMDFTNNELPVAGQMGQTENWMAEVNHCRARLQNPEKFPLVDDTGKCD